MADQFQIFISSSAVLHKMVDLIVMVASALSVHPRIKLDTVVLMAVLGCSNNYTTKY